MFFPKVSCIVDPVTGQTRCPTNFPSGPSMAATFDRTTVATLGNTVGRELRIGE
jgi:beta-glucosidase-like glycosyl hydrolase